MSSKINICGITIDNVNLNETINLINGYVGGREPVHIVTPNVDHVIRIRKDQEFRYIYDKSSLILPDGMPLIWASILLGTPLKQKISGSDLFPKLCEISAKAGYKLFFLGGKEKSAEIAKEVFSKKYPDIKIVGVYCPPFGFEYDNEENKKIVSMIKEANTDILFVGVGSPKQEKWIYKYKNEYRVPVSIGIGASFDFVSGMVKRAPVWMQKSGFEWFWRLIMEPKRLWKRYLIDDPVFYLLVLRQKLGLLK